MSSFGRLLNWMIPSLGVQDDQLWPDASYVDRVLGAADDIRLCERIFNGWATRMDQCVQRRFLVFRDGPDFCRVRTEKPDERERDVRQHLGWLTESARLCSEDTDKILRCHAQFASFMAWQIDGASMSSPKGLDCGTDTKRLANMIAAASRSLSHNVVKMMSDLDSFVSYVEKMQVKMEQQSTAHWILGWLKLFFNVLAGVLGIGLFVVPFPHPVASGVRVIAPAASTLCLAAAKLCEKAAGTPHRIPVRANE